MLRSRAQRRAAAAVAVAATALAAAGAAAPGTSEEKATRTLARQPSIVFAQIDDPSCAEKARLFAIAVGTDDRPERDPTAAARAKLVAAMLAEGGGGLYAVIDSRVLVGSDATKAAVEWAFEDVVKAAQPCDTFVFYFAGGTKESLTVAPDAWKAGLVKGHALASFDSEPYLALAADPAAKKGDLPSSASSVSAKQLKAWHTRIQARQQVAILDSGKIAQALWRSLDDAAFDPFPGLFMGSDSFPITFITRSLLVIGPSQGSSPLSEGAITQGLQACLKGEADVNGDGRITAWELQATLAKKALDLSKGKILVNVHALGRDFPVARAPGGAVVAGAGAAPERARGQAADGTSVPKPGPAPARKDYALLIATDEYTDRETWGRLENPIADAVALQHDLETLYGFETKLLRNPTYSELHNKLAEYQQRKFGPEDQLLVFVAGHGQYDELTKEGFVVSSDSRGAEPFPSFTHSRLRDALDYSPCRHILVLLDVCFGGTFDRRIARRGKDGHIGKDEFVRRQLGYKTRVYIASGGRDYVPDGAPGHHSPFAREVLATLRNGAARDYVTSLDLMGSVASLKVPARGGDFGDSDPGAQFLFLSRRPAK